MKILRTASEMQCACRELRDSGKRGIGFVPTMGALHEGHLSLVRAAKAQCDVVVASIFVNPTQFAAGEDFEKYPRVFEQDCAMLEAEGVEILFAPSADEMYPAGASTFVEVAGISDRLDGVSRPGHFRGVATVVLKLFNIVGPERAYFGQKDAAQVAVLQAMVKDLNVPVELVVCPTVREGDGLAMSSRNRYLSAEERVRGVVVPRALERAKELLQAGEAKASLLREAMLQKLVGVDVDYVEVVDAETLLPVEDVSEGALMAVAAWVGKTRLIDNVVVEAVTRG